MQQFMSLYPEARVQLECLHPHKVVEAVLTGRGRHRHHVVSAGRPRAHASCRCARSRWRSCAIRTIGWRVGASSLPAELNGEPFVAFDAGLTIRKAIDRALRQHNVRVNIVMEFDNIETIKQAIIIAAGVSILPAPHGAEGGVDPHAGRRAAGHAGSRAAGRASFTGGRSR